MRERLTISPERYALVARIALVMLTLIVLTGAAVRLTGSGLGCPEWPKCTQDSLYTDLNTHGIIENGNRLLTFFVGFAAIGAAAGAFLRRPYRRDLARLGFLLPLGVVGQAVLGGFTVRYDLAPGLVMSHYILSMLILIAAVALDWRARRPPPAPDEPPSAPADRLVAWGTWALLPLGGVTIFAGTAATAAGPHAGGSGTGDVINRLDFKGLETLDFVISQHGRLATALGLAAVALWFVARRRGSGAEHRAALTTLCLMLAAQGAIGIAQYALELPAEMVWVHVTLAAVTWVVLVRAVAAVGRPAARVARAREPGEPATVRS